MKSSLPALLWSGALALAAACGAGNRAAPTTPPTPAAAAPTGTAAPAPAFENPGGMWTPEQIKGARGLSCARPGWEIDPAQLFEPDVAAAAIGGSAWAAARRRRVG